jgi:ribosomal protein S18 acetylase RimI-like enzyme
VKIRKAIPADLPRIQELNAALFNYDGHSISHLNYDWPYNEGATYFKKMISGDKGICLIAEDGDRVAGYMTGSIKAPESYRHVRMTELDTIFIEEEFRYGGIGKRLMTEFTKWSRQQDAQKIFVSASAPNEKAINFYKSVGFEPYSLELELDLENGNSG